MQWHGRALLRSTDFKSLTRIGASSKVEQPLVTGRFGLGFNAVYHFTDVSGWILARSVAGVWFDSMDVGPLQVPSFVSGRHLVLFDPHTQYLPGKPVPSCGTVNDRHRTVWVTFQAQPTTSLASRSASLPRLALPLRYSFPIEGSPPRHVCIRTGLTPATSAPGLGSFPPLLHRTGLTPATSAPT